MIIHGNERCITREFETVRHEGRNSEKVAGFHGIFLAFFSDRTFDNQEKRAGNDVEGLVVALMKMPTTDRTGHRSDVIHLVPPRMYQLGQRTTGVCKFEIRFQETDKHIRS